MTIAELSHISVDIILSASLVGFFLGLTLAFIRGRE